MRFIRKEKQVVYPKIGDTKIIKRFLYFPLTLGNETRWWETANIECEYMEFVTTEPDLMVSGVDYYWIKVKFVD